jgi:RHS repeat-associated protein
MDYDGGAQTFDAAYTWDNEGRMTGINYGPSYSLQYDVNGRLSGMQDTANGNATVASASYGVAGEMLGLTYFGDSESHTYNNLLQMTRMTVSGMMDMQYVYQAGQNNGRIVQSIDGIAGETVNYTYDPLNRLSAASATNGSWGQAFTCDGFGNLTAKTVTQGSAPSLSVSYDPATNHQIGPTYDANGNLNLSYWGDTFDVENRLIASGNDDRYAYDPNGKRVKKSYYWNSWEYYFYSITGQKLITVSCDNGACGGPQYNVYFGGKLVKSKGVVVVTDRLGRVRANSNGEQFRYFPYAEERTSTADNREKFGTYTRDNPTQDYADQRYYGVGMGRFNSPDPLGSNAANAMNPTTWNRFGYTPGDPINRYDPRGLSADCPPDDPCTPPEVGPTPIPPPPGTVVPPTSPSEAGEMGATMTDLIDSSRRRLKDMFGNMSQLQAQLCAGAIGASSADQALARISSITIEANATQVAGQSLGPLILLPDGSFAPGQALAAYNPNTQSVDLNRYVNWVGGNAIACLADGTHCQSIDLARGEADRVGATGMSGQQFMDLEVLHEIAHSFGASHPGADGAANDTAGYQKMIWESCFK